MSDDYTPSTDEVRINHIGTHPTLATGNEVRRMEEFDRWLATVRADAWDEGYEATGGRAWHEREATNPYREKGDDRG